MGRENRLAGIAGEIKASEYLRKNGYKILEKNFRTPFGEIDIVARRTDLIIFVEVKTRTTSSLGPPYLAVTPAKVRHLVKNAWCYLKCRGLADSSWRIDIVSVKLNCRYKLENIEIIENAVQNDGY